MQQYISTNTIKQAYEELSSVDTNNSSILHIFLIIKGCGINRTSYEPLSNISSYGIDYAEGISILFSPDEETPDKYSFINPFHMKGWDGSSVTESLHKWVSSRIKNNVIGGATTWRKLIDYDSHNDLIKFTYDYVNEIKLLTLNRERLSLPAIAVWANRFTKFDNKITLRDLINDFIKFYRLDTSEINSIFNTKSKIKLNFSSQLHDTNSIRALIGAPNSSNSDIWLNPSKINNSDQLNKKTFLRDIKMVNTLASNIDIDKINKILESHKQILLTGPPGTSKSYHANNIADKFYGENVTKLQFHPQYSYTEFMGGYYVEKDEVHYRKGIILKLLDLLKNDSNPYLLIIDEINRANIAQVFGETIQCLDRDYKTTILSDGEELEFYLPENLHIIATMNTTDKTIGSLDFAVRRRFLNIYLPPTPDILIDLCPTDNFISLCDLLKKINQKLLLALNNREFAIGHSFFLDKNLKNKDGIYEWTFESLEVVFNYKVLPMIEQYCHDNLELITSVIGEELIRKISGKDFEVAIKEFIED